MVLIFFYRILRLERGNVLSGIRHPVYGGIFDMERSWCGSTTGKGDGGDTMRGD